MAKVSKVTAQPSSSPRFSRAKPPELKQFECGIHAVTYMSHHAGCPVCQAERDLESMRNAVRELKQKLEFVSEENHRLQTQVDIVTAIREAALILDDNDLEFLKVVLYQWRDAKSIGLKTTHGARMKQRKGEPLPANGFIVMPRQGDPYGHVCTSMGGVAIAEYFDEATNTVGPARAMDFLVKGLCHILPGAAK
jgi:hypothetical protein